MDSLDTLLGRFSRSGMGASEWIEHCARALRQSIADRTLVSAIESMSDDYYRLVVAPVSRETPTHRKWFIGRDSHSGLEIWMHRFHAAADATSYAASVHNHRYTFAAGLLNGCYTTHTHEVKIDGTLRDGASVRSVVHTSARRVEANDVYALDAKTFHSIDGVGPGTTSIVVQLPPDASVSYSVDPDRAVLVEHRLYADHREMFVRDLSGL